MIEEEMLLIFGDVEFFFVIFHTSFLASSSGIREARS
jgi:hypothetical protein